MDVWGDQRAILRYLHVGVCMYLTLCLNVVGGKDEENSGKKCLALKKTIGSRTFSNFDSGHGVMLSKSLRANNVK